MNVGLMLVWFYFERLLVCNRVWSLFRVLFLIRIGYLENEFNIIDNGVMRVILRVIVFIDVFENVLEVSY